MAINQVVYSGKTLIDLTSDTVTPDSLLTGHTAHKSDGTIIVGTMFEGYPDEYDVCQFTKDSNGDDILDSSGNVIQGRTVYQKV